MLGGAGAGTMEIIKKSVFVIRVSAVLDDCKGAFFWAEAAQVGVALFGHEDGDFVLGVVDVGAHRND